MADKPRFRYRAAGAASARATSTTCEPARRLEAQVEVARRAAKAAARAAAVPVTRHESTSARRFLRTTLPFFHARLGRLGAPIFRGP